MRQLTLTLLSLVSILAMAITVYPSPAMACSCTGIEANESFARQVFDSGALTIIGEVTSFEQVGVDEYRADVAVEITYGSQSPATVTVITDGGGLGCGYGASLQERGRHFMILYEDEGAYNTTFCSAFPMSAVASPGNEYEERYADFLDILGVISRPAAVQDPGVLPATAASLPGAADDASKLWLIAPYIAVSLAVLAGIALIGRRIAP